MQEVLTNMVSFLQEYRRIQKYIFYTGLCPFRIDPSKSFTIRNNGSTLSCTYKLIMLTLFASILTVQFNDLNLFVNLKPITTAACIRCFKFVMSTWIYLYILLFSVHRRRAHADLMNDFQLFDRHIDKCFKNSLNVFESHTFYRRLYWLNVGITFGSWSLSFSTLYAMRSSDDKTINQELMETINELTTITFSLASMHIGNLAVLLRRRYEFLFRHLNDLLYEEKKQGGSIHKETIYKFDLFDLLWKLTDQFQNVFGQILLLTISVDLMLLIITTYFAILVGILMDKSVDHFLLAFVTYTMMPILKNAFLIWSLDGIGGQVSWLKSHAT